MIIFTNCRSASFILIYPDWQRRCNCVGSLDHGHFLNDNLQDPWWTRGSMCQRWHFHWIIHLPQRPTHQEQLSRLTRDIRLCFARRNLLLSHFLLVFLEDFHPSRSLHPRPLSPWSRASWIVEEWYPSSKRFDLVWWCFMNVSCSIPPQLALKLHSCSSYYHLVI